MDRWIDGGRGGGRGRIIYMSWCGPFAGTLANLAAKLDETRTRRGVCGRKSFGQPLTMDERRAEKKEIWFNDPFFAPTVNSVSF